MADIYFSNNMGEAICFNGKAYRRVGLEEGTHTEETWADTGANMYDINQEDAEMNSGLGDHRGRYEYPPAEIALAITFLNTAPYIQGGTFVGVNAPALTPTELWVNNTGVDGVIRPFVNSSFNPGRYAVWVGGVLLRDYVDDPVRIDWNITPRIYPATKPRAFPIRNGENIEVTAQSTRNWLFLFFPDKWPAPGP